MDYIKIGVGVVIFKDNKILLGHRSNERKDTGGIIGNGTWTLPGGKQEYNETLIECAIREVKEETNLNIINPEVFSVNDDIAPDRHYVTISLMATEFDGDLTIMEPTKEDEWKWFDINELPENLYAPSVKSINDFKEKVWKE